MLGFGPAMLARAKAPERLFFALMPDEESAFALARFAEDFLRAHDLAAAAVKPGRIHIALHRLGAKKRGLVYGAKLAGQAVAAAGLTFAFDAAGRVGRGVVGLTSMDKTLSSLHDRLGAMLVKNGLRAVAPRAPHIVLAHSMANLQLEGIAPLPVSVSGLLLLRSEGAAYRTNFQVLRRWPLNRPQRLVYDACASPETRARA